MTPKADIHDKTTLRDVLRDVLREMIKEDPELINNIYG